MFYYQMKLFFLLPLRFHFLYLYSTHYIYPNIILVFIIIFLVFFWQLIAFNQTYSSFLLFFLHIYYLLLQNLTLKLFHFVISSCLFHQIILINFIIFNLNFIFNFQNLNLEYKSCSNIFLVEMIYIFNFLFLIFYHHS